MWRHVCDMSKLPPGPFRSGEACRHKRTRDRPLACGHLWVENFHVLTENLPAEFAPALRTAENHRRMGRRCSLPMPRLGIFLWNLATGPLAAIVRAMNLEAGQHL